MQIQYDGTGSRIAGKRSLLLYKQDCLGAISKHLELILLAVLIESMSEQKYICLVIFHN